jgi:hypothetical protein
MYLGFPISQQEMYRVLNRETPTDPYYTWWETSDIQIYFERMDSKLIFTHVDKNVFAFGLELTKLSGFWMPFMNVQDAKEYLSIMNQVFWDEVKKLDLDLSVLTLEQMEDEQVVVYNAQPILFG